MIEFLVLTKCNPMSISEIYRQIPFFFFLYMINIAYCNLKDFDYATDLLSDLSLGIETSVVDHLICYFILQLAGDPGSVASIAGSDHGLTMNMQSLAPSL